MKYSRRPGADGDRTASTPRLIEQAGPQLKLIASFSNGTDHIDVEAAARKGITVTNTPNVLTEDTADMTVALILAVPPAPRAKVHAC